MASNIPDSKRKFLQSLERKIYSLNNEKIKEQVIDFTVLYLRRNNIRHTPEDLNNILEVFRLAMEDSYLKNVDMFIATVDKDLDVLVESINPLNSTDSKKSSTTVAGTVREESAQVTKKPASPAKKGKSASTSASSKSR